MTSVSASVTDRFAVAAYSVKPGIPCHLCSVSNGSGMYEIRFETQMKTNSDAMYGNQVLKTFSGSEARPIEVSAKS